jgi:integrase
MARPKQSKRPDPVVLASGRTTFATAYANRPPTKKNPNWSWKMVYNDGSSAKPKAESIGRMSVAEVEKELQRRYREYRPSALTTDGSHIRTVADLLRAWYAGAVEPRGPNSRVRDEYKLSGYTLRNYRTACKQLVAHAGGMKLKALTTGSMDQLLLNLQQFYASRTIVHLAKVFKLAVKWGKRNGIEIPDVEFNVKRPAPGESYSNNHRTPTHEEVEKLYGSLRRSALKVAVLIGWKTGGRIGEISGLCWGDIVQDVDGCWVHLKGKTGAYSHPLSLGDYGMITAHRPEGASDDAPVFKGGRGSQSSALSRACTLRGIDPFTFHGLRRLRCDDLQRAGVEPSVYAAVMGHSVKVAMEAYRQPSMQDLQSALRRRAGSLERALAELGMTGAEALRVLQMHRSG